MAVKNRYVLNNDASMQITIAERSKEEMDELIVKLKTALKGMQLSLEFYHVLNLVITSDRPILIFYNRYPLFAYLCTR